MQYAKMGGLFSNSKEPFIHRMPTEEKKEQAVRYSNIAAIDFGTTYCSLAYKTIGDPDATVLRLDSSNTIQRVPNAILLKVIDKDYVCTICHCQVCENKEQCDSCYDIVLRNPNRTDLSRKAQSALRCEVTSFGSQAQREYPRLRERDYDKHILFERMKLSLMKNQFNRYVKVKAVDGREFYAVEVISVILKYIKDKFLSQLSRADGKAKKASDFQWVITVPAIWKPRGKQVMREAAILAGLCTDDIHEQPVITRAVLTTVNWPIDIPLEKHPERVLLAFEPEAAAIELASTLQKSSRFLVVDIGGGTVDIAAHELSVVEDAEGAGVQTISRSILEPAGNEYGGIKVNKDFERFITELVGAEKVKKFQEKERKHSALWNELIYLEFEKEKVAFGDRVDVSHSKPEHEYLSLRLDAKLCDLFETAFPCDHIQQGVSFASDDQVLHISHSIIEGRFFRPVADGAMQCIRSALQQINERVDTAYLVGGFGGCKYIYSYLRAQLQTQGIRVIEAKESNLTVIRGAVRFGYNPQVIASRKADATYGITTSVPFDSKKHDKSHRYQDSRNQYYCNNILYVCVEKGEVIPSDRVFTTDVTPPLKTQTTMILKIVMTNQTGVEYTQDKQGNKNVTEIGSLVLTLPTSSESDTKQNAAAADDSAKRNVRITLDFSGTELKARAHFNDMKEDTSKDIITIVDFL